MLHEHQSPAAGTKGFDTDKLALFFAVRIQYDMDRITRDVLYLLYYIWVPILCKDFNGKVFFSTRALKVKLGQEKESKTKAENRTYIKHSLRSQPSHQPMIAWGRCGDYPEARQSGELNCIVADCRASPVY